MLNSFEASDLYQDRSPSDQSDLSLSRSSSDLNEDALPSDQCDTHPGRSASGDSHPSDHRPSSDFKQSRTPSDPSDFSPVASRASNGSDQSSDNRKGYKEAFKSSVHQSSGHANDLNRSDDSLNESESPNHLCHKCGDLIQVSDDTCKKCGEMIR